ncbi:G-protein coupled receptor [Branchiostoma belcheri]|nr:G-protein coupled receptor [Branchiostoma belcheri]
MDMAPNANMSWLNLSCEDDFVCPNRSSNSTVVPPWSSYQHDTPVTVLYILVYSLVFILCVLGNLAVCWVVAKTRQLHTATFYFIFNLAVADLLVALFCMPFTLVAHILVVSLEGVKILDSESDFFARGVKEAVYIRAHRPTLNRDGGRHKLSGTCDPLLRARVSDVTFQE